MNGARRRWLGVGRQRCAALSSCGVRVEKPCGRIAVDRPGCSQPCPKRWPDPSRGCGRGGFAVTQREDRQIVSAELLKKSDSRRKRRRMTAVEAVVCGAVTVAQATIGRCCCVRISGLLPPVPAIYEPPPRKAAALPAMARSPPVRPPPPP